MTAPEPVEVTPDELADAEGWFVYWQTVGTSAHDGEERRAAMVLEAEYKRRGEALQVLAELGHRVNRCSCQCTCNYDELLDRAEALVGLSPGDL